MKAPRGRSALQRGVFNALGSSLQRSFNAASVGSEAIEEVREKGGQMDKQKHSGRTQECTSDVPQGGVCLRIARSD
jgi:hypothetical protein